MDDNRFVLITYRWPEPVPASLAGLQYSCMYVNDELVEGFLIQMLPVHDPAFPVARALKCYAQLQYGNLKPTAIWSSKEVKEMFLEQLHPAIRRSTGALKWWGGFWQEKDFLQGDDTVILLNEQHPMNPRLNGCYHYTLPM